VITVLAAQGLQQTATEALEVQEALMHPKLA
jgi:hypothetical protein